MRLAFFQIVGHFNGTVTAEINAKLSASDRRKISRRKYYLENRSTILAQNAKWWKEHPDKLRAKWRRKRWKNLDKRKAYETDYRARNLQKVRASRLAWQKNNAQHRSEYMLRYEQANKAKLTAYRKRYNEEHREQSLARSQNRRRLEKTATVNLASITAFFKKIKRKPASICYYCENLTPVSQIHFDHIIPLAQGGAHSVANICVSCSKCNLTKQNRTPQAWVRIGQQVLAL